MGNIQTVYIPDFRFGLNETRKTYLSIYFDDKQEWNIKE